MVLLHQFRSNSHARDLSHFASWVTEHLDWFWTSAVSHIWQASTVTLRMICWEHVIWVLYNSVWKQAFRPCLSFRESSLSIVRSTDFDLEVFWFCYPAAVLLLISGTNFRTSCDCEWPGPLQRRKPSQLIRTDVKEPRPESREFPELACTRKQSL